MYKKRILIILITVMLTLFVLTFYQDGHQKTDGILFHVLYENENEDIKLWQDADEAYYVFLPSNTELDDVYIRVQTSDYVWLDGKQVIDGMSCGDFQWDTDYTYSRIIERQTYTSKLTFVHSENVPAIFLDTQSGNMKYIHEDKGNKESGLMRIYTADGALDFSGNVESIESRGNDSWSSYDKKAYNVKFLQDTDLLDMGAAKNWILLANASDPSHLRNKLAFLLAKKCGIPNSPETQWVDFYLNGEYWGLYLLSEKNEIHGERLDISSETGVLVSLELEDRLKNQNLPYVLTENAQSLRLHSPRTQENFDKILEKWQTAENAIMSKNGIDEETGNEYSELIDVDSWRRKYLLEEVLGNLDAGRISQFFFYEDFGKIYAGPVWDYDLSMGNKTKWQLTNANGLFADRYEVKTGVTAPWFYALCRKDDFRTSMIEDYQNLFKPQLIHLLDNTLIQYQKELSQAVSMNQIRWAESTSMAQEICYIRKYLMARLAFLDNWWINNRDYCVVRIDDGMGSNYSYATVLRGMTLDQLPELQDNNLRKFTGWYTVESHIPFNTSHVICEDIDIYAGWEDTSEKKAGTLIKMVPVVMLGIMGLILLITERNRWRMCCVANCRLSSEVKKVPLWALHKMIRNRSRRK